VTDVVLRPYEAADRPAVRRICHVTGYMGGPAAWYWRDAASFADLFTGYYTDEEPGSASVCEIDGDVAGYLLGCADSRTVTDPARVFGRSLLRRALVVRPGTAGLVWRSIGDAVAAGVRRQQLPPSSVVDARWPAHLHVDLLPVARGRGVGASLVRHWLERLRSASVAGCHLQTLSENTTALSFFEAMGFTREGDAVLVPGLRTPDGGRHHVQLMVQPL